MAGWSLFESTDSVIEVLWDVALAFFIVRLAFIYYVFNLVLSVALTYIIYTARTLSTDSVSLEQVVSGVFPYLLLNAALWARYLTVYYDVPRLLGFRLATGLTALCFMLATEAVAALVVYEEGYGGWLWGEGAGARTGGAAVAWLAAYALMPTVMMVVEKKEGGGEV
ncbi:hypothetical protein B0T17DRAFT_330894 [Bombardia bombarda]|uniref:Uncharacterized protein n=1 Tax=Bombardia bombarda TaxID=252184 RepID=A0AA39WMU4_9PEZI|nr:hypothetical protein B0T17DRAFT_330894 [Bombardia bombarda]